MSKLAHNTNFLRQRTKSYSLTRTNPSATQCRLFCQHLSLIIFSDFIDILEKTPKELLHYKKGCPRQMCLRTYFTFFPNVYANI